MLKYLLTTVFLVAGAVVASAQPYLADPAIYSVYTLPANFNGTNQSGKLYVQFDNGASTTDPIYPNSLYIVIDAPSNVEITGFDAGSGNGNWALFNLTTGTGNTAIIYNIDIITPFEHAMSGSDPAVNIISRSVSSGNSYQASWSYFSAPSTCNTAGTICIPGRNPLIPGPNAPNHFNTYQGNADASNDNATSSITVLPLRLISFDIKPNQCNYDLVWVTTDEVNTSRFDVEYSATGTSYTNVGTVAAMGSGPGKTYTFSTPQTPGQSYYRLKMWDRDGKFRYSPVRMVTSTCSQFGRMTIFPNPVDKDVAVTSVTFFSSKFTAGTLQVYDVKGNMVQNQKLSIMKGTNSFKINLSSVTSGMYKVIIKGEDGSILYPNETIIKL